MIVKTTSLAILLLVLASFFSFFFYNDSNHITGMVVSEGYVPTSVDKTSLVSLGDIFIHYSNAKKTDGLNSFQESINKFSQNLIVDCSSSEDKELCVNQKIVDAKNFNLVVDDCRFSSYVEPINFENLKAENLQYHDNRFIHVGGFIKDVKKYDERNSRAGWVVIEQLTLKQADDTELIISFESISSSGLSQDMPKLMNSVAASTNQYLEIKGHVHNTKNDLSFAISGVENHQNSFSKMFFLNSQAFIEESLKEVVVKVSDCALSPNITCLCKADVPLVGSLMFFDKEIKFKDYSVVLPVNFFGMDVSVSTSINKYVAVQQSNTWARNLEFRSMLDGSSTTTTTEEIVVPANYVEVNPAITKIQKTSVFLNGNNPSIVFKKDFSNGVRDFILVSQSYDFDNNQENLQECDIVERHFLFCASPLNWGSTQIEKDYAPSIKFALKI